MFRIQFILSRRKNGDIIPVGIPAGLPHDPGKFGISFLNFETSISQLLWDLPLYYILKILSESFRYDILSKSVRYDILSESVRYDIFFANEWYLLKSSFFRCSFLKNLNHAKSWKSTSNTQIVLKCVLFISAFFL